MEILLIGDLGTFLFKLLSIWEIVNLLMRDFEIFEEIYGLGLFVIYTKSYFYSAQR